MTNSYNIAGANGSVMLPVLTETGSLMAYLLYTAPTGILQEYYPQLSIPVAVSEQSQSFSLQRNTYSGTTPHGAFYQWRTLYSTNFARCLNYFKNSSPS